MKTPEKMQNPSTESSVQDLLCGLVGRHPLLDHSATARPAVVFHEAQRLVHEVGHVDTPKVRKLDAVAERRLRAAS